MNATTKEQPAGPVQSVVLVLFDQFPLIPFSCVLECMRAANRFVGETVYRWHLVSADGEPVCSSSGVEVAVSGSLPDVEDASRVLLIATNEVQFYDEERVLQKLVQLDRRDVMLGSASSGSFVLARAGLLEGYRSTIHWRICRSFASCIPSSTSPAAFTRSTAIGPPVPEVRRPST